MELGVRFTPGVNGTVTGIRFYKGTLNTGTHTGTLWSGDGTQLATGLIASASTDSQSNGTHGYGSSTTFPSSGSSGTNYWVDVVFANS